MKTARSIRGMSDILPEEVVCYQFLESVFRDILHRYGYDEIRLPLVEYAELFRRSIGCETDIVEKEMYTFLDRSDELLCLRPEGTAGCVRAAVQNGLISQGSIKKLWYMGSMFRYERPQRGRQRQFNQMGVEVFGEEGAEIEVEMLLLCDRIWRNLNIEHLVELEINTIGDPDSRKSYVISLASYLQKYSNDLDDDSKRRLNTNPLRILDSKDHKTQEILSDAPNFMDFVDYASRGHFEKLCNSLERVGIPYTVNVALVRGLDYYNRTVFEWTTKELGAQGTICGGGRYDGLVEKICNKSSPAVGCAFGIERLVMLIKSLSSQENQSRSTGDVYIVAVGEDAQLMAIRCAENIRSEIPSWRVLQNLSSGSIKSQLKRANKSDSRIAIIIGPEEVASKCVTLKFLREDLEQESVVETQLISRLKNI